METSPTRLAGFDDLRLAVIALVVLVHANVTYSGIGSWYYVENRAESLDTPSLLVFGLVGTFLQAWFMGTLFFVGGLFSSPSLDRKGRRAFLTDRAVRLLGPFFAFLLVVAPLMLALFQPPWLRWSAETVLSGSGPLWFTGALFLFTAVWALAPRRPVREPVREQKLWRPRSPVTWAVAALVAGVAAWAVRLVFPIGTSWFNFQLCFFPAYVALFGAGTWLGRGGRFGSLPSTWSRLAWITPLVSLPVLVVLLVGTGALDGDRRFFGGANLPALGYALWESATAVGMTLGLAVGARDPSLSPQVARPSAWRQGLRDHSFAVYFLHAPVLWGLALVLAPVGLNPLAKAPLAAALTFALTLALAVAVKKVPGLGKLLA